MADVTRREDANAQANARDQAQAPALAPAVDIFEDRRGITVQAEMPGVSKDRLNVQADRNGLLIEGDVAIDMPQGIEAVYADVRATKYRRNFTLSSELDPDGIEASLKDGLLTVRIPKRAEFTPRKIDVQVR
ncbi:MAG TPA: Hsp20/alpha crystallin family protein [Casimicrobiaceae bacterium]|nr:Hsp20/alpha crystallin family protein [Casimicrobiaceae bacterium]